MALRPLQRDHHWRLERNSDQTANVGFSPRFVSDGMTALRDAAIAGVGLVQFPAMMVAREIEAGTLVHVLPDRMPQTVIVHAVFASGRGVTPFVRALLDFLATGAAARRVSGASGTPTPAGVPHR